MTTQTTMNTILICRRIGMLSASWLLAACTTVSAPSTPSPPSGKATPTAPNLGLFSRIKAPGDTQPVLQLAGRGVQVFRCEKRDAAFVWVFRQPDSELIDEKGAVVGRHGASFSFEHVDGSRLVATIAAFDDAPQATDLRWLLMTTRSYGKGSFEGVTQVQRINTRGGMPPERCESGQVNQVLRVNFSAEFIFYRPKSGGPG
jgi:hypothetical protein